MQLEQSRAQIQQKISELPLTLSQAQAKEAMITKAKSQQFWNKLSEDSLEELRLELRSVMRFRDFPKSEMEKLDLEDMTLIKQNIEFGPEMEQASVAEYRKRLEARIQNLLSENEVLQRLKKGEEIDDVDIEELARILQSEDPYITLDNLQKVYDNRWAKFIDFINHILDLQKLQTRSEIIVEAFDRFIQKHSDFNSQQIRFLQVLKTFTIERGQATKENLVSPPFTHLHPEGVRGIFKPAQITEILSFVKEISEDI